MLAFLLGMCLGLKLLGHMVTLCMTLGGTARLFSLPKACTRGILISLHLLCIPVMATLREVRCYLIVVLVCMPLMVDDVGPYFSTSLPVLINNFKNFFNSINAIEHFIMLVCISANSGFACLHKCLALGISYSVEFCSYLFKFSVGFPMF